MELEDEVSLQSFRAGDTDSDPALEWYIDVECTADDIPGEPLAARQWLLDHATPIRDGLLQLSKDIERGVDVINWPLRYEMKSMPSGARVTVSLSAVRRITARELGHILCEFADDFENALGSLKALQEA